MKKLILFLCCLLMLAAPALAMGESVVFEGEKTVANAWTLAVQANTTEAGGTFDPECITEGGHFAVEYSGTPGAVYLALSEWTAGSWSQVDSPAQCTTKDGLHTAIFTYAQVLNAYGKADFSEVDQICIGSANAEGPTTVRRILWVGKAAQAAQDGTVIFEGEATVDTVWKLIASANTTNAGGSFDPADMLPGGYFTVEYEGTSGQVYFAMSEWTAGTWSQVNEPAACQTADGLNIATFTYEQCVEAFGSSDFTEVDALNVGSANSEGETTVRRILWHGKTTMTSGSSLSEDAVTLYRGSARSKASNTNMAFVFTKHAGGEFDAAQINAGSRFYVEHSGTKGGVYLAFSSHSGAKHWVRVNASEIVELENGRFASYFDYSNFAANWGTNFARLDQLTVFSSTSEPVKLHRIAYIPGTGAPVDGTDGRWDRPDAGIAFIGDSICQNAALSFGDWNKILGRTDCCNFGIGGQTTVNCLARIDEVAGRDYSHVVFICGINDIGWNYTAEQIVCNFDGMISAIRAKNPDCQFILVSVLPTTEAFYKGQQDKIVQLNKAYRDYAEQNEDVTYVDTYSSFTSAPGEYAYPQFLSDGLHPNAAGYAEIARVLNQYLPAE